MNSIEFQFPQDVIYALSKKMLDRISIKIKNLYVIGSPLFVGLLDLFSWNVGVLSRFDQRNNFFNKLIGN